MRVLIALGSAALLLGMVQSASAGQVSATMNVSATVSRNCVISTGPANQTGLTYDPVSANLIANNDFTTSVTFNCTKNSTGVTTGITLGSNSPGAGLRRLNDGGTNNLNYNLYQPAAVGSGASCAYTQAYDTSGAGLFSVGSSNFTTSTTAVVVKICGRIPGAQDVPTGTYTDSVSVQVNF